MTSECKTNFSKLREALLEPINMESTKRHIGDFSAIETKSSEDSKQQVAASTQDNNLDAGSDSDQERMAYPEESSYVVTVDDDQVTCFLLEEVLELKNFSFKNISDLMTVAHMLKPVGIFLDIHLQDECGLDHLQTIRQTWPDTPIIVITGDNDQMLIGQALAGGADDYIQKPLVPSEVIARLNVRREEKTKQHPLGSLNFGDISLNLNYRTLVGPKGTFHQSPREVAILGYLIKQNGVVVPKENLKTHVWGNVKVSDNALSRKIFEVRRALKNVSDHIELRSVYGRGVVLRRKSFDETMILLDDKRVLMEKKIRAQRNLLLGGSVGIH